MKEWRQAVFERDCFTCILCGQIGGNLHADHIWPFALMPALALTVWNGRTLCGPCHKQTPTFCDGTARILRELIPDATDREMFARGSEIVFRELIRSGVKHDVDRVLIPLVGPR